ncbi:hypothetical protein HELRODRAFT_172398 [Helobdella robusta]|uniref:Fibrinogen C-terminal domain-containing protein n=1 Tax=Helobdella robusta TaxID=6412 RepID=T1F596_HELRO|nr:hypothetical protein HELRODRAFT_172398 [Helobdella robusta]ESO04723.1 hypothetical protein HELRODRAFT_172398 [Helobdella robusta]
MTGDNKKYSYYLCSIEEPTASSGMDLYSLDGQSDDQIPTFLILCAALCRYKLPGQAACQGFNVRFDSGMCELYRYQSVYFAQQFGCVYHALKPVNRKGIVVTPVYPYQHLLNKPPPPKNKPTPTFTFLVQIKLKPDSTAFNKSWSQFKVGFSVPNMSISSSSTSDNNDSGVKDKMSGGSCGTTSWDAYWIGNELLYQLTNKYTCSLHVYLSVNDSGREELYYSHYDRMVVGGQTVNYQLITLNYFGGNLSTASGLSSREGRYFSTYDDDNDPDSNVNCALAYTAGWWYHPSPTSYGSCGFTNFNTQYPNFLTYSNSESFQLFSSQMWVQCY